MTMYNVDLSGLKTLDQVNVAGQTVLVRADLNVPMAGGRVTDTTRLDRFAPTVRQLASAGAKIAILSHFGRPGGAVVPELSLRAVAGPLAAAIGREVEFVETYWRDLARIRHELTETRPGDILLLENTRFHPGEEMNDPDFAARMASLGTLYVNDAFSCTHRAHASTEGIAHHLPSCAGPSLAAEIGALQAALDNPKRPVGAVVGGAKVSTKIPVLTNMVERVDVLIIGGGMANTFLHAQGINVGKSLCEPDFAETARDIMVKAKSAGCRIVLPVDAVVATEFRAGADTDTVAIDAIPSGAMMLDIGPKSVGELTDIVADLATLLWNGPLGAFEIEPFGTGTFTLAREAARLTSAGKLATIAGGGDTVAALNQAGVSAQFSYISTAGGAFLEWLEGRELPGIVVLAS